MVSIFFHTINMSTSAIHSDCTKALDQYCILFLASKVIHYCAIFYITCYKLLRASQKGTQGTKRPRVQFPMGTRVQHPIDRITTRRVYRTINALGYDIIDGITDKMLHVAT